MSARVFPPALMATLACLAFSSLMHGQTDPPSEGTVWRYQSGDGEVRIDQSSTGQIVHWAAGGKVFVDQSKTGTPLTLRLADGRQAQFQPVSHELKEDQDGNSLIIEGVLRGSGIKVPARLRYTVAADASQIGITLWAARPELPDALVQAYTWSLPLALSQRKKVYFRGEHGLDWESRYFYQFAVRLKQLLIPPDTNEWRWFSLDQLTPDAFRLSKAESETTSRLNMQEGRRMLPYVQVQDPERGITLEVPRLAETAPKSLRIDASGGATAHLELWPSTVAPTPADATGLFDVEHHLLLTASADEAALLAKRAVLNAAEDQNAPDVGDPLLEPEWIRAAENASAEPMYATGGYPFAPGEVTSESGVRVAVAGKAVPHQAKTLAYWPDGSAKWVLLTFPIDPAMAQAKAAAPYVSLRTGKFLPVSVSVAHSDSPAPKAKASLSAAPDAAGGVSIANGPLSITFSKGEQWLSATLDGEPVITPQKQTRLAYTDYLLNPTAVSPLRFLPEGGKIDPGALNVTKLELEEKGPLRAVVRMEGMTGNQEPTRVILRAIIEAGRPEIRLMHSAEFLFKDPRSTFLSGMGIELPLQGMDLSKAQLGEIERDLPGETATLLQETPVSRVVLTGNPEGPRREAVGGHGGWITASGGKVRFFGSVRNFAESAPKAITLSPDRKAVRFEIWPRSAGLMDVRRYSNRPHLSQGESVTAAEDWVDEVYYKNEPFVGESRSHEMLLGFWPERAKVDASALAADFQSPPLLYAGWDRYMACGVVLPQASSESWPKAAEAWTNLTKFWLYHRALHRWYGFWDFGDFRHHFRSGYGWTASPEAIIETLASPTPKSFTGKAIRDYQPPNDWAYDNGRWGWSNTEGLPNLFLQHEYLRHGHRAVYFAAEAMARFSRDVVIRHDGMWFGKGTRHGVQHWSDGNHEERQTTTTEFRLHYFLSGDARTRDVVEKLFDRYYTKTSVNSEAAHSGRWGGLFFHWEMSGSRAEAQQLRAYAHSFISSEGLYLAPSLKFPGPLAEGKPKSLNGGSMFFSVFGAMHNLIEYQRITGDQAVAEAIIKWADSCLQSPAVRASFVNNSVNSGAIHYPAIAFAAMNAKEPAPYRQLLTEWMQGGGWKRLYQTVSENSTHWSGDTAFLDGNMPGCLFWNNWAPYVTRALGNDTIWNSEIARSIERTERAGDPSAPLPLSWQSEFDEVDELSDYLGKQTPWRRR